MSKIHPVIRGIIVVNSGAGDEWGWAMSHTFALTELQHFRGDLSVPDSLGFRPSPVQDDVQTEEWPDAEYLEEFEAGNFTSEDIDYALRVLSRYLDHLKHQGVDY